MDVNDRARDMQKGRKMRPYITFGASGRTRTADLVITNHSLYRLSHRSIFGKGGFAELLYFTISERKMQEISRRLRQNFLRTNSRCG